MWALELQPGCSRRAASAPNSELSLQPHEDMFVSCLSSQDLDHLIFSLAHVFWMEGLADRLTLMWQA